MRARADPLHSSILDRFRDPVRISKPVSSAVLDNYKELSVSDITADTSWRDAMIVYTGNSVRQATNYDQAIRFAKSRGVPVVVCRLPLDSRTDQLFRNERDRSGLYEHSFKNELHLVFVVGAPVFITENIAPEKGLANGTPAVLHSLTLPEGHDNSNAQFWAEYERALPGSIVVLPTLPYSVNIRLPHLSRDASGIHWPQDETLEQGDVIVPIKLSRFPLSLVVSDTNSAKIYYHDFPLELGFAVTYHKVQGQTVNKIILDLRDAPKSKIRLTSLYVGLSRVRKSNDIRVLPLNGAREHLYKLTHTKTMVCWYKEVMEKVNRTGQSFV